jgi:TfoX/Sxy family transcriptional regulator of competence genes
MSMPRTDAESKQFFADVIPGDPRIVVQPMFGSLAGFINGNMFTGLFGEQIFVRLPEKERQELLEVEGASEFSPMPGRPMKEYAALPDQWRHEPDKIRSWIETSLAWAETLPVKEPKKSAAKSKTK